jgi:hypothetical protein
MQRIILIAFPKYTAAIFLVPTLAQLVVSKIGRRPHFIVLSDGAFLQVLVLPFLYMLPLSTLCLAIHSSHSESTRLLRTQANGCDLLPRTAKESKWPRGQHQ